MADSANHKKRPAATRERTRSVRRSAKHLRLTLASATYSEAVGKLVLAGWQTLHALVGAHVVTFGSELGDEGLAAVLQRVSRRDYKPSSVARARRELTAAGVLR